MTRDFERLTQDELADQLAALEDRLASHPGESRLRTVVQNLRIHQIELEMQNRELRDAQHALEEARDRYADLYDFAPIGYMTLNANGVIDEINLTGARMLGKPRAELLGSPLSPHLESGHSKAFFRHLNQALGDDDKASVELALRSASGHTLWVLLESLRRESEGATLCRTAMLDISERRESERLRRESEDRLALIADNVSVLIAYVDADRRYVFNNAAYERWFGYSRDYIHGRRMHEILGDEVYEAIQPYVDAALAGEESRFELNASYPRGGTRHISGSYVPHKDDTGTVLGFFVLINDLSERYRAERALSEERAFATAVLDTAGALVMVVDSHGQIVRFNRECERVTGYRAAEVEGRRFDMFLMPNERSEVEKVFKRLNDGAFPNHHENRWRAKDGSTRLIAWSNTALTDSQGRVSHIIATGVDVTERRRMEDELRHQEQQLRLVTDAVPILIAYVDRDMRYRFVNAAYQGWYGIQPGQMVGRPVEEFTDAKAFAVLRPFADRALKGQEVSFENTITHRRLGKRDVSVSLVPDRNQDGRINGYFSVLADITERKRGEESDKRRLLQAAHTDRLSTMGEMTTEIAHELNQPLTAIATTADVLVERARCMPGGKGVELSEALGEIRDQAHRAARIIKHLRTFARRREPDFAPVGLDRIIESALSLVGIEARSGGVTIDTSLRGPVIVEADSVLVEQLIVNLARNAVEAMVSTGVEAPRMRIAAMESNGSAEVTIADNGPGLSGSTMEHLFEPFYTTKPDGMGLGLAICRSIVEAHGGTIWADASPEGGAEFGFTLTAISEKPSRDG
ncbi:MAG: PAS domain S-box protein [Arenicellales bacterium]